MDAHFGTHFVCTIDFWYFFYQNSYHDKIAFIKAYILFLPKLQTRWIFKATCCSRPSTTVAHNNHCQPNMHTCLPITKMTLKEQTCIVISLYQDCPSCLHPIVTGRYIRASPCPFSCGFLGQNGKYSMPYFLTGWEKVLYKTECKCL